MIFCPGIIFVLPFIVEKNRNLSIMSLLCLENIVKIT